MSVHEAAKQIRTGQYVPDILDCLAQLSNDEVPTPPKLARALLDILPAEVWSQADYTWLDPFCKSGIFLREAAARLLEGLSNQIPDFEERRNHIYRNMLYGTSITEMTGMISRRSLYYSRDAAGPASVVKFDHEVGNLPFVRAEHDFPGGGKKCSICDAPVEIERGEAREKYAYSFIHGAYPTKEMEDMKFDVIVGNPPYQMKGGGGGTNDSSIYHLFVEQALSLQPRYLTMIIPSRWLAGGRGMDAFRKQMLTGGHVRTLVDYTKMSTAFPGVDFEGGVGYFLWDRDEVGTCDYTLFLGSEQRPSVVRELGTHDIFVRDDRAAAILDKIRAVGEPTLESTISGDTPFGLATNFADYALAADAESLPLHINLNSRRTVVYVDPNVVTKNTHLIDCWKVLLPKAYGERGAVPANVLGPSLLAAPGSVCTQTYLVLGPLDTESEATNVQRYLNTRIARFLISLRKISQDLFRSTYSWVPQQDWNVEWTDAALYAKYGLTKDEVAFIESQIRPMGDAG